MTLASVTFTADELMADVRRIVGFGWRRNGSESAAAAAEYFRAQFDGHGLDTHVESWPFNLYYPLEWFVRVQGDDGSWRDTNSIPIWYSMPGNADAPMVYLDARTGPPALADVDMAGRIVVVDVAYAGNFLPTDGSSTRDAGVYAAAVRAGAVGYVRRAGASGNGVMLMHFAQNFPTHDAPAQLGAIPAFTVGQRDFDAIARTARAGGRLRISNTLAEVPKGGTALVEGGSLGPGSHRLRALVDDVVGILPGASEDVIVIAAHYDSTFDGAVDNATGGAVLLALMRHFASLPREERAKTLVFLASGAHDTGDFDLYHFVETHRDDILARTVAFDWLDHMAADASAAADGSTVVHGVMAAENTALRLRVRRHMEGHGIPVDPILGPLSTISHLPPEVPSFNVTLAPSWYHSPEDTVEKVPAAELATMAHAQLAVVTSLLATERNVLRPDRVGDDDPQARPRVADGVFFTVPADLPRGRHKLDREDVLRAQRERLLIAATELLAVQRNGDFGIRELCESAAISPSAFYKIFPDRPSCIFAAYERFIEVITDRMMHHDAAGEHPAMAFVRSYVDTLQQDLVTARAFQVEMETLGHTARHMRREALAKLASLLTARLLQGGMAVSSTNMLTLIYAVRQFTSDLLDEYAAPDLGVVVEMIEAPLSALLAPVVLVDRGGR